MIAGGAELPVVGNNPFSIAIPTFNDFPFVLDMALSVVARGKISYAAEKGVKIPLEWATDKGGRPTDDPKVALDGFIQAMGGYKGIAIAYAIDATLEHRFLHALPDTFAHLGHPPQPSAAFAGFGIHVVTNNDQHAHFRKKGT